ncbi:cytochrome P450 [Lophiotrema nucula]|uniref:Cytochrome P450 n=1 Tax=Lophiotrema nucula TaxID=690887 RepID=A0A6A5YKV5_9PLEO|nr:cytochrome P450 [Lophiotrema nucula]
MAIAVPHELTGTVVEAFRETLAEAFIAIYCTLLYEVLMDLEFRTFGLIVAFLLILLAVLPKRTKLEAARVGGNPGLLGFKTLPAKIRFPLYGHAYVEERYARAKDKKSFLHPSIYLPQLRSQTSATLNASLASVESTIGEYSGVDIVLKDRQSHDICRTRLSKSLPTLILVLAKAIQALLNKEFKDCIESGDVSLVAHKVMFSLNVAISSLIYVGPKLYITAKFCLLTTNLVIQKLKFMDSFIKESQRCNPHSYLGFNRVVTSDIQLSDGTTLHKDLFISIPAGPMGMDPAYFDEPESFDPRRFYKKATLEGDRDARYELVGINEGNLNWGDGKLTCPGRCKAQEVVFRKRG